MDDNTEMPLGKFKGTKMANVPADYLKFLYDNGKCYGELKRYIEDNMELIDLEIQKDEPTF